MISLRKLVLSRNKLVTLPDRSGPCYVGDENPSPRYSAVYVYEWGRPPADTVLGFKSRAIQKPRLPPDAGRAHLQLPSFAAPSRRSASPPTMPGAVPALGASRLTAALLRAAGSAASPRWRCSTCPITAFRPCPRLHMICIQIGRWWIDRENVFHHPGHQSQVPCRLGPLRRGLARILHSSPRPGLGRLSHVPLGRETFNRCSIAWHLCLHFYIRMVVARAWLPPGYGAPHLTQPAGL